MADGSPLANPSFACAGRSCLARAIGVEGASKVTDGSAEAMVQTRYRDAETLRLISHLRERSATWAHRIAAG